MNHPESGRGLVFSHLISAPDEVLMMSRKHCHTGNVSSIVLRQDSNGCLTRVFLALPGHKLGDNRPDSAFPIVGPHDHRYRVTLEHVCGVVINYSFVTAGTGWDFKLFRVHSGVVSGRARFELMGRRCLQIDETQRLDYTRGCIELDRGTIHTMGVLSATAAWLVTEGPKESDATELYAMAEPDTAGLYEPFTSPREVIEHVAWFFRQHHQLLPNRRYR